MRATTTQSRRTFLKTATAAGGGLMIGFYVPVPRAAGAQGAALAGAGASKVASFEPNVWIRIGTDDKVRIMLSMLEMGQGVMTAMPMLVAEELDIDWNNVTTEWAPADRRYGNPNFGGAQTTAGSQSTRGMWKLLREAGAAGRAMLITAAAQRWGVPESSLATDRGVVFHAASGRRARYGELVEAASKVPVPAKVTLKDPKSFKLLGRSLPRLDIPEKVDGRAIFGIDVTRPGLLVARVVRCPVFGGRVARFNAEKAKAVPGVKQVVQISSGIAVVADTYWAASKGAQALEVVWDEGRLASLSSEQIRRQFAALAERPGAVARSDGDVQAALASGARVIERVFEAPYLAHAPMEPMNCTAHVQADRCDVWVSTQSQTMTHEAAIAVTGLPPDKVFVHTQYLGGGFGRRGETDFVVDAVETSKAVGAPVKVIWTREDDMHFDYYRPYTYVRMWAALDGAGNPIAWMQRIVQPSLLKRRNPKALEALGGVDRISVEGAATLPYAIPNLRVEYIEADPGVPYGFWRSVGASVNGYVTEAFIDEVATTAGKDPYQFRRALLGRHPRHRAVLDLVAEKAGWGTPLPGGRHRGIALHECFGSIVGVVAEVSVDNGSVRVHRITCAVDCGWYINPDTIVAQMEGGLVYGLTAALKGEITIRNGRVVQNHFGDYPMLRINEMPVIDVHIVPSTESPGGIGEPATAPIAGAVANAVFAATGKRVYSLPIRAAQLRSGTA
ncbi:MAG TPA: xanthine dehydrogenase family protein molybdopterin-binding subunit [Vicinamibacterales bacterium]|nr:xanthine dehydrogenase family protein molybdopterin-binding subunit [Vicinamibacterales bacterium]